MKNEYECKHPDYSTWGGKERETPNGFFTTLFIPILLPIIFIKEKRFKNK